jgi:hypothetical protein
VVNDLMARLINTPADEPLPERIGRYQVLARLGAGGMGSVYRAHDPQLRRDVAIKVPRLDTPAARERFLREARAAAAVRHPNVCPIHDVGEEAGRPYVVMALVEGGSLAQCLRRLGRFEDCRQAVTLVAQVADALDSVHAAGVIHRDLKPGNILLDGAGQPLLSDFGLARASRDGEPLTVEGTLLGTPAYMAPEQVSPELGPVGPWSDQYSLAVVLYQLLTGRLPFEGSVTEVIGQIGTKAPPPPSYHRPDLDPALESVLLRALAQQSQDRYSTAGVFARALRDWQPSRAGDAVAPVSPPETLPTPAGLRPLRQDRPVSVPAATGGKRRGTWLLAGAGVVLLSVVVLAVLLPRWLALAPEVVPLKGSIDVQIYDEGNPRRQDLYLDDAGALPLRPGDQICIEAELNRPAYLYVLWIDTEGQVLPVYPWRPGHWESRPEQERPVARLRRPEDLLEYYPVRQGAPGMETLVLLARPTPLPRALDLRAELGELPRPVAQELRATAWFEDGLPVHNRRGRAGRFDVTRREDAVLATQQRLKERLGKHFTYMLAVSFANQGK